MDDSDSDDAEEYDTSAYAKYSRVGRIVEEHGPDERRLRKYYRMAKQQSKAKKRIMLPPDLARYAPQWMTGEYAPSKVGGEVVPKSFA